MHDPFPIPPPSLLVSLTRPFAAYFNLTTLPLHIHEFLLAALVYHLTCRYFSPLVSSHLFPRIYPQLSKRTKLNWDVHVVSLVQAVFINTAALWVMFNDEERGGMGWEERVWGYTGADGMIQGFAAGYFLWDLWLCGMNVDIFGWGLLAHSIAALVVFLLGFRPFVNFYGPTFILYELSSPFLNFHWFFDKLHMTGSRPQWYNGIVLLSSFFCCRLLWGTYQSIRVSLDVWAALHYDCLLTSKPMFEPSSERVEIMKYAGNYVVPTWLAVMYLGSNLLLNTLNVYWFGKMVETISKRFTEVKGEKGAKVQKEEGAFVKGLIGSGTLITEIVEDVEVDLPEDKGEMDKGMVNGRSFIEIETTEVRRRRN